MAPDVVRRVLPGAVASRRTLARNEAQLATAKAAYEKALNVKKMFMREKEKKTAEAMTAIRDARRAKWQSKVADAMESFEVAGIDATHDEMIRKVEEQTAVNEARMQMALESVDHQAMAIEEEAEKIQANELVKQFKMEMGLDRVEVIAPDDDVLVHLVVAAAGVADAQVEPEEARPGRDTIRGFEDASREGVGAACATHIGSP